MKISKFTTKEISMVVFLVIFLIGITYYLAFYKPIQADLTDLANQSIDLDNQISMAMTKVANMKNMQEEIDEILSQPKSEITEIAPFDNKEVVFNMLNGILMRTSDYSLNFADPQIEADGFVRRNVSMQFNCPSYEEAKAVIQDLTKSNWRCLVSNCSIVASESVASKKDDEEKAEKKNDNKDEDKDEKKADDKDMLHNSVSVSTTITFFESEKLAK